MLTATVSTIVGVAGGVLLTGAGEQVVAGVAIDSREVTPGALFVALNGERLDGHDYANQALDRGARALLVTRAEDAVAPIVSAATERGVAVIQVADAARALQDLASWHRERLHCQVVGVTGSTGKTTTKDLLRNALSNAMRVVSTVGNRNNELGLPLTILSADVDCGVLVVEMGMRGAGQIAQLARIAQPTIGLITNVGTSHIELLGSQESIADAKAELVRAIPERGAVFLNGDDSYTDAIALESSAPVTSYGLGDRNTVRAECVETDDEGVASFDLVAPQGRARVTLPVPGRHNVYNALAAASVALHLGVTPQQIAEGISAAPLTAMRMELVDAARGVTVLNDSYNANPTSMRAAIDTLVSMRVEGHKVAVLGDMAELGTLSELAHFGIGEQVARSGIDVLVTVGTRAVRIADGARAEGMASGRVRPCTSVDEAIEVLDDLLETGDAVLVKASRVMGLEAVVEGIVNPRV